MDQLKQNQASLIEEVSRVRAQMRQLMETIQAVARGQEIMARIQEEIQQRANIVVVASNVTTIENRVPPYCNPPIQIPTMTPGGVLPPVANPSVIEIDEQHDLFFSPRVGSVYDAFGPLIVEVENKVCTIKEKLKAIEGSIVIGLDVAEMCLVPGVRIPAKFKVLNFEKYKGVSDPRMHIRFYCRKMASYSDDERLCWCKP